jgi:pimeloyl-ACP methyl ester carboxylesterase
MGAGAFAGRAERELLATGETTRTALVVVDMQNDFVREGGGLLVPDAKATIPAIRALLELAQGPPTPALAHRFVDEEGFVWLTEDDFVNHFAGDVEQVTAEVLYAVQQPLSASAFEDVMGVPSWKAHRSWYLIAQDDQALPPDAERAFADRMGATSIEVPSGHLAMVTRPAEVVELVETAAEAALAATAFR